MNNLDSALVEMAAKWVETRSAIIRRLAAIINAPQTDAQLDAEVIPRHFVMSEVIAIREACDLMNKSLPARDGLNALRTRLAGGGDDGRDAVAAYPFGQSEYPEYVIRLLIAAGYVTQAKVDEARAIALNLQPGPMTPQSEVAAVDDAMVERAVAAYMDHDDYGVTRELIRALLTAALNSQQAGEG